MSSAPGAWRFSRSFTLALYCLRYFWQHLHVAPTLFCSSVIIALLVAHFHLLFLFLCPIDYPSIFPPFHTHPSFLLAVFAPDTCLAALPFNSRKHWATLSSASPIFAHLFPRAAHFRRFHLDSYTLTDARAFPRRHSCFLFLVSSDLHVSLFDPPLLFAHSHLHSHSLAGCFTALIVSIRLLLPSAISLAASLT